MRKLNDKIRALERGHVCRLRVCVPMQNVFSQHSRKNVQETSSVARTRARYAECALSLSLRDKCVNVCLCKFQFALH